MSDLEFSVVARACLKRRNPVQGALQRNIGAFEAERNEAATTINWRFTTEDGRAKVRRPYPDTTALTSIQEEVVRSHSGGPGRTVLRTFRWEVRI